MLIESLKSIIVKITNKIPWQNLAIASLKIETLTVAGIAALISLANSYEIKQRSAAVVISSTSEISSIKVEEEKKPPAATILFSLGALGLGVGTVIFGTRKLSRATVEKSSKKIPDRNLQSHEEDNETIVIERGLIADSFNIMFGNLQQSFENLEAKVKQRTAELASANEQIKSLNQKLKADNLRMSAELNVARQIQQMILPKKEELEEVAGLDIVGFMESADEVGGDYYDVLQDKDIVTLAIGDVTGHGLESGILMLMTQMAVRTLQEIRERDPVRFLNTLNRTIYQNVQRMNSEKNLTLAILNYCEGKLIISGQHEETLVVRVGGQIERIDMMDLGLPIGIDDDIADFIDHTIVELRSGDGVVLYTDGIPEAYNLEKEQYGLQRMCDVISQNWDKSAEAIKNAIIEDVRDFIGEQKVFDDITLLIFKQLD